MWGERDQFSILRCRECGLAFFDRAVVPERDYQDYYSYSTEWDSARVSYELRVRQRRFDRQLKYIEGLTPGRSLLDIGAGPGYFCVAARERGWSALGVEVSDRAREIGTEFLSVTYTELESLPPESFDVITCFHVIEHVSDTRSFLDAVRTLLRPGGILVAHVPNLEPLSFWIRNLPRRLRGDSQRLCHMYVPDHVSGFTRDSLGNVVTLAGFDQIGVKTVSFLSKYYDPLFVKLHLQERRYGVLLRHVVRESIDVLGVPIGRGDWVVGHFQKGGR